LLDGNVFSVKVDQARKDSFEPLVRIVSAQIAIAGVEVDADGLALDQTVDAIQSLRLPAVLLMRFQANQDAARFRHFGRFHERVTHEHMIFFFGGPRRLRAFIGVHHRRARLPGEANGLFQILDADFRFAQGGVGGKTGQGNSMFLAGTFDPERVVEHRHAMEVTGFTEQLAAPVQHGFDEFVTELSCLGDAPLEVFVFVPDEFQVDAKFDCSHKFSLAVARVYKCHGLRIGRTFSDWLALSSYRYCSVPKSKVSLRSRRVAASATWHNVSTATAASTGQTVSA